VHLPVLVGVSLATRPQPAEHAHRFVAAAAGKEEDAPAAR